MLKEQFLSEKQEASLQMCDDLQVTQVCKGVPSTAEEERRQCGVCDSPQSARSPRPAGGQGGSEEPSQVWLGRPYRSVFLARSPALQTWPLLGSQGQSSGLNCFMFSRHVVKHSRENFSLRHS